MLKLQIENDYSLAKNSFIIVVIKAEDLPEFAISVDQNEYCTKTFRDLIEEPISKRRSEYLTTGKIKSK